MPRTSAAALPRGDAGPRGPDSRVDRSATIGLAVRLADDLDSLPLAGCVLEPPAHLPEAGLVAGWRDAVGEEVQASLRAFEERVGKGEDPGRAAARAADRVLACGRELAAPMVPAEGFAPLGDALRKGDGVAWREVLVAAGSRGVAPLGRALDLWVELGAEALACGLGALLVASPDAPRRRR